GYTGPAMNPANAFGWAYVNNRHNTWEQLYVYWVCPFIGAILAAWTFRMATWIWRAEEMSGVRTPRVETQKTHMHVITASATATFTR
ncbi:aquaporin, partial [Staphylococcus aureus]|nr:aquaporin [Staphylococcus aureus]